MTEGIEAATEATMEDTTQRGAKEEETAMTEDAEDTAQTQRTEEETGEMMQISIAGRRKISSSNTCTE